MLGAAKTHPFLSAWENVRRGAGAWQQSQLVGASQHLCPRQAGSYLSAALLAQVGGGGGHGEGHAQELLRLLRPRALPPLWLEPQRGQKSRVQTPKPGSYPSADLNVIS